MENSSIHRVLTQVAMVDDGDTVNHIINKLKRTSIIIFDNN